MCFEYFLVAPVGRHRRIAHESDSIFFPLWDVLLGIRVIIGRRENRLDDEWPRNEITVPAPVAAAVNLPMQHGPDRSGT